MPVADTLTTQTTQTESDATSLRLATRCAAPAALLALLVLLPFVTKAFTIDDVTFLLQAKHVLVDPLHPTAFEMVFHGLRIRLSQHLVTGPVMAYLLVPTVLLGSEWSVHVFQAMLVVASAIATAALALRLGLDQKKAPIAAILLVASPAVLGMAGTAMPDVAAMAFAVIGVERFVAWQQARRWPAAVVAALFLALAALARPHVLLVVPCTALWLVTEPGSRVQPRWSAATIVTSIAPLVFALVIAGWIVYVTRDPASGGSVASATLNRIHVEPVAFNLASFAAHWVVAFPLGFLWPLLRGHQFLNRLRTFAAFATSLVLLLIGREHLFADWRWSLAMMLLAGHGIDVMADIIADAWRRRDRIQMVLVVWLLIGAATATYALLTPKVLLVSAPAMAILLARRTTLKERGHWHSKFLAGVVTAGVVVGLLVLRADAAMAEIGRQGGRVVASQKSEGRTVWMDGAWGFQWYAMQAGAEPLAKTGPVPEPGDVVVAGPWARRVKDFQNKSLIYRRTFAEPGGRVTWDGAGFFSNLAGPLPWVWADSELGRIEVWRIDSPSMDSR